MGRLWRPIRVLDEPKILAQLVLPLVLAEIIVWVEDAIRFLAVDVAVALGGADDRHILAAR